MNEMQRNGFKSLVEELFQSAVVELCSANLNINHTIVLVGKDL